MSDRSVRNFAISFSSRWSDDQLARNAAIGRRREARSAGTRPPAGPTGFSATGVDAETVDFAWTDNSAVEDGYEVWVYQCSYYYGCYPYAIATLGPNTTSYRYQDPTAYWYTYAVVAKKDGGQSDVSEIVYPTAPPSGSAARER